MLSCILPMAENLADQNRPFFRNHRKIRQKTGVPHSEFIINCTMRYLLPEAYEQKEADYMKPKLEACSVSYSYHTLEGETPALSDISFLSIPENFLLS